MQNAVALGTFDGIHKGHLAVLNIPEGYNKIALIFTLPPKNIKKGISELLLTPEEKIKRLEALGFSVVCLDFSEVEHQSPEEFLEYINDQFSPSLISCGFNYRFGFGGKGDTATLAEFCGKKGVILKIANAVTEDCRIVSSSRIRECLKSGKIAEANQLLGYNFSFTAEVIKGDGRGRTLGFPTINQRYPEALASLKFGVYKTEITIDNNVYEGVTNIGTRPTFPVDYIISETFIKDFSGDLYGQNLKIAFKDFLREEKKFSSPQDLKIQIYKDLGV